MSYDGGSFESQSLGELREALPTLERRDDIDRVTIRVRNRSFWATVRASSLGGVSVVVEGTRAGPVHGLVTTLQRKLEGGVERVREQPLGPYGAERIVVLIIGWVVGLGLTYLTIDSIRKFGFDVFYAAFLGIWIGAIVLATGFFLSRERADPPHLELVPQSDEDKPPPKLEAQTGPILRTRDWLGNHPIVSIVGVLAVGVVGNLIANALN